MTSARHIKCALGLYQTGTPVDFMELKTLVTLSTPTTATWTCTDSNAKSGHSYNADTASGSNTNFNNCMANGKKSYVKIDKKNANFNFHFHRPFKVQPNEVENKKTDSPLSVG